MTRLIESARASGRWLHVVTYHDGPKCPIEARLLFKRPEDAQRVAEILLGIDAEQPEGSDR